MNISYKKILFVIIVSVIVGLMYNQHNQNGIPLIMQKKNLVFETDSLLYQTINETKVNSVYTISNSNKIDQSEVPNNEKEIKKNLKTTSGAEFYNQPKAIKIDIAYKLFQQGIRFIDARMPEEYAAGHIKNAYNIPFDGDQSYRKILDRFSKDEIIVVYCGGSDCNLSTYLGNELFEKGFKNVYIFFGGWNEWIEKNYPIDKH